MADQQENTQGPQANAGDASTGNANAADEAQNAGADVNPIESARAVPVNDATATAAIAAHAKTPLATLTLAAMGVVYGDIGTSPLYAFKEAFGRAGDRKSTRLNSSHT